VHAKGLLVLEVDQGDQDGSERLFPNVPIGAPGQAAIGHFRNSGHPVQAEVARLGDNGHISLDLNLGENWATIVHELPCDYHTAHRIIWLVRKRVVRLEAGWVLQGTIEADEIYVTAGHKGQPPGGGCKDLAFSPQRRAR